MIRKIILENYMAHVRTVIEPAAGLTVLIGPNNCGKSAIVHALEMICYNSDAAHFAIRHGAKKATVTIETVDEDGTVHTLIWWRTKSASGYCIDGREISGAGRKVPDDLHKHLRMPLVQSGGNDPFLIHFGLQKRPIFLLDEPPSRAAQFFASSSDADRLMEMQRRHKQKETNARRDKEKLDREIEKLDADLAELSSLPMAGQRLAKLEIDYAELIDAMDRATELAEFIAVMDRTIVIERYQRDRSAALLPVQSPPDLRPLLPLESLLRQMEFTGRRANFSGARQDALARVKPVPELADARPLARLVRDLAHWLRRAELDRNRSTALAGLRNAPELREIPKLREQIRLLERAERRCRQLRARRERLAELPELPALGDAAALGRLVAAVSASGDRISRIQSRRRLLEDIPAVPDPAPTAPLRQVIDQLAGAVSRFVETRRKLSLAEKKLTDLRATIDRWVEANPRCQSCGQDISAELILSGEGHAHD
jgi:exonuclease SbcC